MIVEKNSSLLNCFNGDHNLIEIYRQVIDDSEENVIRWCNICGSVVVDGEYDGITHPGKILKMLSPQTINMLKPSDY